MPTHTADAAGIQSTTPAWRWWPPMKPACAHSKGFSAMIAARIWTAFKATAGRWLAAMTGGVQNSCAANIEHLRQICKLGAASANRNPFAVFTLITGHHHSGTAADCIFGTAGAAAVAVAGPPDARAAARAAGR